jgi:hypothetical protein
MTQIIKFTAQEVGDILADHCREKLNVFVGEKYLAVRIKTEGDFCGNVEFVGAEIEALKEHVNP